MCIKGDMAFPFLKDLHNFLCLNEASVDSLGSKRKTLSGKAAFSSMCLRLCREFWGSGVIHSSLTCEAAAETRCCSSVLCVTQMSCRFCHLFFFLNQVVCVTTWSSLFHLLFLSCSESLPVFCACPASCRSRGCRVVHHVESVGWQHAISSDALAQFQLYLL